MSVYVYRTHLGELLNDERHGSFSPLPHVLLVSVSFYLSVHLHVYQIHLEELPMTSVMVYFLLFHISRLLGCITIFPFHLKPCEMKRS